MPSVSGIGWIMPSVQGIEGGSSKIDLAAAAPSNGLSTQSRNETKQNIKINIYFKTKHLN